MKRRADDEDEESVEDFHFSFLSRRMILHAIFHRMMRYSISATDKT